LTRQVALWVEDPQVAEMMLVSTSRRGLTQQVTDLGVLPRFVGLRRWEVLAHLLDVAW
jgi:hypothetical protein